MPKLRTPIHAVAVLLTTLLIATIAEARVISYAPYSQRLATATFHRRTTQHFALIESRGVQPNVLLSPLPVNNAGQQLVLYDAAGAEEPRVIYPIDGGEVPIGWAALRENAQGVPTILVYTLGDPTTNPSRAPLYLISSDGGVTWKNVWIPSASRTSNYLFYTDAGGPFTRGRYSPVRLGTDEFPFVVQLDSGGICKIKWDGNAMLIHPGSATQNSLIGSNAEGTQFIVRWLKTTAVVVDLEGKTRIVGLLDSLSWYEGWIGPDDSIYLERSRTEGRFLYRIPKDGPTTLIAGTPGAVEPIFESPQTTTTNAVFLAVPTSDYDGAWIIQRGLGLPTTLSLSRIPNGCLACPAVSQMWSDVSGPQVEALLTGATPDVLLIQVHRDRAQVTPQRVDPALAVWRIGQPAPSSYDELYLNEGSTKGFIHVDVDKVASGEPFVFDSGMTQAVPSVIISPAPVGGGSDVVQEWGVVRGSLKQQLVLPGVGRTPGAYGSNWATDVVLYNPESAEQKVLLQFVPNGSAMPTSGSATNNSTVTVTLAAREIRLVPDVLKTIFSIDNGTGVLFLTPENGINATSRTYNRGEKGTFGFGMNAIDLFASASPRFPVSFAGAFPGRDFRTNLIVTDASGRGSRSGVTALGGSGVMGFSDVTFLAPSWGQLQINGLANTLGLLPSDNGGLLVTPRNGWVIASVFAVDNRTNDPTFFPPDIPASVARTIPVIGHVDGVNDSKFRTDLYLFNPSTQTQYVTLTIRPWNTTEQAASVPMTLLPNEARVINDVYFKLFGRTGIAKLTFQSGLNDGVRVTSRTYNIDDQGGTFGFLTPPMNAFQSAASGEALEILGVTGGRDFRTNLGLVELSGGFFTNPASARIDIIDNTGKTIDSFTTNIAWGGGFQINDIFRSRNLGDGPPAALIRISPITGQIGAYATVTDNGTNDGIYLAPNLAARQ